MCDVIGWIIDAVAACGTVAAVVVALWQVRLEKRARVNAEKRRQAEKDQFLVWRALKRVGPGGRKICLAVCLSSE